MSNDTTIPIAIINHWLTTKTLWNEGKKIGKLSIFNNSDYANDLLLYLFNINREYIIIVDDDGSINNNIELNVNLQNSLQNNGLTCISCGLSFEDKAAQVFHFKSNLHQFNLQRKLKGLNCFTDAEFNSILKVAVQDDKLVDNDSELISDDDSDDDDKIEYDEEECPAEVECEDSKCISSDGFIMKEFTSKFGSFFTVHCKQLPKYNFFFSLGLFTSHSSLLSKSWTQNSDIWNAMYTVVNKVRANPIHAVLLLRSGRFAAAVYDGVTILVHKVLRRYTVRAKAGGGQSSHDNKSGKAKSAGAMLRRYGEQALKEDIHALLNLWIAHIQCCSLICIAAPKTMRSILFETTALSKDDSRISYVPFPVDKPTLEEVKLVHERCTTILYKTNLNPEGTDKEINPEIIENYQIEDTLEIKNLKLKVNSFSIESNDEIIEFVPHIVTKRIIDACTCLVETEAINTIQSTITSFEEEQRKLQSGDILNLADVLDMPDSLEELKTPLHYSSELGMNNVVYLLLSLGASPMVFDIRGRRPYYLSKDKDTRDAYRKYRHIAGELKWDWDAAGIGSALSEEIERNQKLKEKEKKKRAAQKKKETKLKEELYAAECLRIQEEEKAIAIQKANENAENMKKNAGNCAFCERNLYGMKPLDVYEHRCCGSDCVLKLRRKLQADAAMKRLGSS